MAITGEQVTSLLIYGIDGDSSSLFNHIEFNNCNGGEWYDGGAPYYIYRWSSGLSFYGASNDEVFFISKDIDTQHGTRKIRFTKNADSYDYSIRLYDINDNIIGGLNSSLPINTYNEITQPPIAPAPFSGAPIFFVFSAGTDSNNEYNCGYALIYQIHPMQKIVHPSLYANHNWNGPLQQFGYLTDFILDCLGEKRWDSEGVAPSGDVGGGGGLYDRPDYDIPIPELPAISIVDTGMCSIYNVSTPQLQQLASYLWSDNFFDNIIKNFTSPLDNIISLSCVPFSNFQSMQSNIKIGNLDSEIQADRLTTTYYEVDCGQININEYYKSFADYSPYQAIHLYLPYVGIVEISPDDVMTGTIRVVYHIDVFSGACVAYVQCYTGRAWHVLHSHTGNIITSFPITGANYLQMYRGLLQTAGNALGGNLTQAIDSVANIKPSYQRSGQIGSTAGMMGIQYPYLIFSTPQYIVADTFRETKGQTSNLTCKIGDCSGFLSADVTNDELININATAREIDMIREALAEGIYI